MSGMLHGLWPARSRLASLHRRTISRGTCVVAVIGTYGKTTTTRMVTAALGQPLHPEAELNDKGHVPGAVLRIRPGQPYAAVEVGIDHPGQMAPFARAVRPRICVVTTVGTEHHRAFRSLEATRDEKVWMVRALPASGCAILNGDDVNCRWMAGQTTARILTYGFGEDCDVRASDLRLDWPRGTEFLLHTRDSTRLVRIKLIGRHMVYPALAAISVCLAAGVPLDAALERLGRVEPIPGRMSVLELANGATLLCDYFKSSYETIHAVLDVLAEIPARRRMVVLGEVSEPPGSQGAIYKEFGARVAEIASLAVFVGSNFQRYKTGAMAAGMPRDAMIDAGRDLFLAARSLPADLGPGDVVLIKGRVSQRLDRVAFLLAGQTVRCGIDSCHAMPIRCDRCPMLSRGWGDLRVIM